MVILQILPILGNEEEEAYLVESRCIKHIKNGQVDIVYELCNDEKSSLTRVASLKGDKLVVCDTSKRVLLFNITASDSTLVLDGIVGVLEKAAMVTCFDGEGRILIGDKFGDIIRFPSTTTTSDSNSKGEVIAGCVSMVTDMLYHGGSKSILMADRNEKVRSIDSDKPWNINSFYLAHTEYVAGIKMLDEERFVSVSGDGRLIVWLLSSDFPLQEFSLKTSADNLQNVDPVALCVDWEGGKIAVICANDGTIRLYSSLDHQVTELVGNLILPSGCKACTASYINDTLYVAGMMGEQEAFLAKEVVGQEMLEIVPGYTSGSIDMIKWDQILRSHLRKKVFTHRFSQSASNDNVDVDEEDEE